jgi:hypothetical protein
MMRPLKKIHLLRRARFARSNVPPQHVHARELVRLPSGILLTGLGKGCVKNR